jgi:hypothetical protein
MEERFAGDNSAESIEHHHDGAGENGEGQGDKFMGVRKIFNLIFKGPIRCTYARSYGGSPIGRTRYKQK